jgi:hypothetical protein
MTADQDAPAEPVPPPPSQQEFPTSALLAVFDDEPAARTAVEAVATMSQSSPYVLVPEAVLAMDQDRESKQNPLGRLWTALGALVSDQTDLQNQYLEQARQGRPVLVASAQDSDAADRIWTVLRGHGAHHGTWFGNATIRQLV